MAFVEIQTKEAENSRQTLHLKQTLIIRRSLFQYTQAKNKAGVHGLKLFLIINLLTFMLKQSVTSNLVCFSQFYLKLI
jgi:hypothetical protein